MVVHNETSTGVTSRIADVRAAMGDHDALLLVDTISSLGSIDYRHDEWGVDVTVGGSQKGLMLPAGLSFNAVSAKAIEASQDARRCRARTGTGRRSSPPTRPASGPTRRATNLLYGLREALAMLREEGLENVFARHARHAAATRAAVHGWGLEVLALDEREFSGSLTAVMLDGSDEVRRVILERFDMSLGAGLGKLKDQVFRIGHLGDFNDLMLAGTLCGVQMGLQLAGHDVGDGVGAALERLAGVTGALDGLRVIELTQVMAGPFCGQVLADMGADVIKVEPPDGGDQTRRSMGEAAFRAVNRNKRSITLDLKDAGDVGDAAPAGRDRRRADGELPARRRGSGSAPTTRRCARVNPRLIYASISGFGQTGPYAQRPGFDLIAQGVVGRDERHRRARRQPGQVRRPGLRPLAPACSAPIGILSALHARERTGEGQRIDTSLWEGALALSIWETAELWSTGDAPQPLGSAHRLTAPYQALRTRDGHITVGGNNQKLWERLCATIGRADLPDDPRFADQRRPDGQPAGAGRRARAGARPPATPRTGSRRCSRPASPPARSTTTRRSSPTRTRRAREMVVEMEHPEAGTVYGLGIPVKLSATPGSIRRPAPLLGQHTDEILAELGDELTSPTSGAARRPGSPSTAPRPTTR